MTAEKITADTVLHVLQDHIGKGHGINVTNLAYAIIGKTPSKSDERTIRLVVKELRMQGQHICACPITGYFMAANTEELNETCKYLLDRAMTGLTQISRMKNVSLPDLEGQLNLML